MKQNIFTFVLAFFFSVSSQAQSVTLQPHIGTAFVEKEWIFRPNYGADIYYRQKIYKGLAIQTGFQYQRIPWAGNKNYVTSCGVGLDPNFFYVVRKAYSVVSWDTQLSYQFKLNRWTSEIFWGVSIGRGLRKKEWYDIEGKKSSLSFKGSDFPYGIRFRRNQVGASLFYGLSPHCAVGAIASISNDPFIPLGDRIPTLHLCARLKSFDLYKKK